MEPGASVERRPNSQIQTDQAKFGAEDDHEECDLSSQEPLFDDDLAYMLGFTRRCFWYLEICLNLQW